MQPNEPGPSDVGKRLRVARKTAGMTQAASAVGIGVARTTLVAVEKGQRRARPDEIRRLAQLYGTSVNAILRREAVHVDLAPRFRRLSTSTDIAVDEAVRLLSGLVAAEVELEALLGVERTRNYPPERPVMPGDVRAQAESDATELRQWLGLGLSPVRDLVSLLDLDLGIRVYQRPLHSSISGLFAYDETVGACILLNATHPRTRRAQSGSHELGHFVGTRRQAEILHEGEKDSSREERYASAFGRAFLTPARTVMLRFRETTAGSPRLTRRHIIMLAHTFGVSREALVRRLEELDLAKAGTWDWFKANGGITHAQVRQLLGDLATDERGNGCYTTMRLNLLAAEAWRQDLLSEGQLARLLHLDRVAVRKALDDVEDERNEEGGMPKLPE